MTSQKKPDAMPVDVNLATEAMFPDTEEGNKPKIEVLRTQIVDFIGTYMTNRGKKPERVVLAPGDHKHIIRRINARLNVEIRRTARADYLAKRAKGEPVKWSQFRPGKVWAQRIHYNGITIEAGQPYSKPRPVDSK